MGHNCLYLNKDKSLEWSRMLLDLCRLALVTKELRAASLSDGAIAELVSHGDAMAAPKPKKWDAYRLSPSASH